MFPSSILIVLGFFCQFQSASTSLCFLINFFKLKFFISFKKFAVMYIGWNYFNSFLRFLMGFGLQSPPPLILSPLETTYLGNSKLTVYTEFRKLWHRPSKRGRHRKDPTQNHVLSWHPKITNKMVKWSQQVCQDCSLGERTIFSTNKAGKTEYSHVKEWS